MEQNNDLAMGYVMGRDGNGFCNGYGGFGGLGGFGGDWLALLIIFALFGNNGFGYGGGGNNMLGYELGKAATQADVASGFNNSAVLSSLNDIKLGQQQAINYNNQGFSGLERVISDCCCNTQRAIDGVNLNLERSTCQIIQNQNYNTQRLLDYAHEKENQELRDRLFKADLRQSQAEQNAYLIDQIMPRSRPAYPSCNPYESSWGWTRAGNGCCGNT
jgi:hypothetical protein